MDNGVDGSKLLINNYLFQMDTLLDTPIYI